MAALMRHLKRRRLLDPPMLLWMGKFGRTPDNPAEMRDNPGTAFAFISDNAGNAIELIEHKTPQ